MVALKVGDIERFLARPDPGRPVILVYGPDAGLVRERAQALIHGFVDDPRDPFALARLEGEELGGAPARLVEEANTVPLLGGRRAVWVRAGARNIAPSVEALLGSAPPDCRVVIEAGDLKRSSPLRTLCERARNAVALPCYADDEHAIERLIDVEMRDNGLAISREARAVLVPLLGGDRLASRHELRKLALFCRGKGAGGGGKPRVDLADVIAVVSDASALALDDLIDTAFAGRTRELDVELGKAATAAIAPSAILSAALRQVGQLHKARLAVEEGIPVNDAVNGVAPYVHFTRRTALEAALKLWTSSRLARAMRDLADAALAARKQSALAETIAQRALLSLAVAARTKG
jgi:DNA polymerase III subunit delta